MTSATTMAKTPTKTNTKTNTMTKTLHLKDISYAIFSKSRELEDIKLLLIFFTTFDIDVNY